MTQKITKLAPLIAIIGCDGSGKSTVSEQVLIWAREYGDAESVHLGKQQGNVGRAIANFPVIGNYLGKFIDKKVSKVNSNKDKNKAPGAIAALVMYAFTIRRKRRFNKMLKLRGNGKIIITDRFPQIDIPKTYDGPSLSIDEEGSAFVKWLAHRELKLFRWMTSYQPDVVIRLNVDLETAFARKPDHKKELLRRKIETTPKLTFNGAKIVEIDASQPLEQVLSKVKVAVISILQK